MICHGSSWRHLFSCRSFTYSAMTMKVGSRIMDINSCVWCQKISSMRCSIWCLRVIGRITSSSMTNSPIHRHVWINKLQVICWWIKSWNTLLHPIGSSYMGYLNLINRTHHVVHRHIDLWGCRCKGVGIHMLHIAEIIWSWSMKIILNRLLHIIRYTIDKTRASRYIMLIRQSSNNICIICIYISEVGIHITFIDWKP